MEDIQTQRYFIETSDCKKNELVMIAVEDCMRQQAVYNFKTYM